MEPNLQLYVTRYEVFETIYCSKENLWCGASNKFVGNLSFIEWLRMARAVFKLLYWAATSGAAFNTGPMLDPSTLFYSSASIGHIKLRHTFSLGGEWLWKLCCSRVHYWLHCVLYQRGGAVMGRWRMSRGYGSCGS